MAQVNSQTQVTEVDTMGGSCQVAVLCELPSLRKAGDLGSQQCTNSRKSLKLTDAQGLSLLTVYVSSLLGRGDLTCLPGLRLCRGLGLQGGVSSLPPGKGFSVHLKVPHIHSPKNIPRETKLVKWTSVVIFDLLSAPYEQSRQLLESPHRKCHSSGFTVQ